MTVKKASAVWKGSVKDGEGGMSGVEADEGKDHDEREARVLVSKRRHRRLQSRS